MSIINHELLRQLASEKRWPELIYYARRQWENEGWAAHKQNGNAVERLKQHFTKLTGKPPFQHGTNPKGWHERMAIYIKRLGVAALIKDMEDATKKLKPNSIVYFLWSGKTQACRWEMLVLEQIERKLAQEKDEIEKGYENLYNLLGRPKITQKTEPDWVIRDKRELEMLKAQRPLTRADLVERDQRIRRIESVLKNNGY